MPHASQVFGASWCVDGSELYSLSVTLGTSIAAAGFKLVNGGYGGTMEGTARGAAAVPGSVREGVIVPTLFPQRSGRGNEFLTEVTHTASLLERIQAMVAQVGGWLAREEFSRTSEQQCTKHHPFVPSPCKVGLLHRHAWNAWDSHRGSDHLEHRRVGHCWRIQEPPDLLLQVSQRQSCELEPFARPLAR